MGTFERGVDRLRRPRARRIGDRVIAEHRLVWEAYHGPIPDGMAILREQRRALYATT